MFKSSSDDSEIDLFRGFTIVGFDIATEAETLTLTEKCGSIQSIAPVRIVNYNSSIIIVIIIITSR